MIIIDIINPTTMAGPAISSSGISGGKVNNRLKKLIICMF